MASRRAPATPWPRSVAPRTGVSTCRPSTCRTWPPQSRGQRRSRPPRSSWRSPPCNTPAMPAAAPPLHPPRHARGGRVEPSLVSRSFDQSPTLPDPKDVLLALAASETPGDYLKGLNPKHPQFERLRQALLKVPPGGSRPEPVAEPVIELPNGPILRPGMEPPHVAFLRQPLGLPATS